MAASPVAPEIENIRKSLESLESKVGLEEYTVTVGSEGDYEDLRSLSGTGQDHLRSSREYVSLIVDAAISKTELNHERKINQVQKELLGEIGGLSKEVRESKPNYFWLFLSVFLASVLTLAAIFVPIIPIYTENVVNNKITEEKKTIIEEIKKYIDTQLRSEANQMSGNGKK